MKDKLSYIAVTLSIPLLILPFVGGVRTHGEEQGIPLLTVLLMSEFAFVLCAVGGFTAGRSIRRNGYRHSQGIGLVLCASLASVFLWRLIQLYPADA